MAEWGRGRDVFYLLNGNENMSFFWHLNFVKLTRLENERHQCCFKTMCSQQMSGCNRIELQRVVKISKNINWIEIEKQDVFSRVVKAFCEDLIEKLEI